MKNIIRKFVLIFFGLCLGIFSLEAFLQLAHWYAVSTRMHDFIKKKDGTINVLCIGESTTESGGWDSPTSWPKQLERILQQRIKAPIAVYNRGMIGANSSEILKKLPEWLESIKPTIVISMIGINDDLNILVYRTQDESRIEILLNRSRLYRFIRMLLRAHDADDTSRVDEREVKVEWDELVRRKNEALGSGNNAELILLMEKLAVVDPSTPIYYYGYIKDLLFGLDSQDLIKNYATKLNILIDTQFEKESLERVYNRVHELNLDPLSSFRLNITLLTLLERHEQLRTYLAQSQRDPLLNFYALLRLRANSSDQELSGDYVSQWKEILDQVRYRPVLRHAIALFLLHENKPKQASLFLGRDEKSEVSNDKSRTIIVRQKALALWLSGQRNEAQALFDWEADLQIMKPNLTTKHNYPLIINAIKASGAISVAMQYPMMSVRPLRALLADAEPDMFVDNQAVFQESTSIKNYTEIFSDVFAGSFGHTTDQGNKILAEHLANELSQIRGLAPDQSN